MMTGKHHQDGATFYNKSRAKIARLKHFFKVHILHADDSPHRIALGAAIGLFVAWTPAIGFHMLMVLGLAVLLRANKLVALIFVWVSNPFTIIPVYYPAYLLGRMILRFFHSEEGLSYAQMRELFKQIELSGFWAGLFDAEFWRTVLHELWFTGIELWLGSLIIGFSVALISYFAVYHFVVWYRKHHFHRLPNR